MDRSIGGDALRRAAGLAPVLGAALLVWGCGGAGEKAGPSAAPTVQDTPPPAPSPAPAPAPAPAPSPAPVPEAAQPPSDPGPSFEIDMTITDEAANALTAHSHSIHYVSRWYFNSRSDRRPTAGVPYCYPRNAAHQAGGECYYSLDGLRVSHNPDDFVFGNVRHTGTLPGGIPRVAADVALTPSASDADDRPVEVVFPAADAAYTYLGGWLEHGTFGVLSTDQGEAGNRVVGWIGLNVGIDRVTTNPRPSPRQVRAGLSEATWTGAMIGKTDAGDVVSGSMRLVYDFGPLTGADNIDGHTVSVSFQDVTGNRRIDSFEDMTVRDGTFGKGASYTRRLEGGFVGERHAEEVLGTFYSNSVTGAFGGKRLP